MEVSFSCGRDNLELVSVVAKLDLEVIIMLLFTVGAKIFWSLLVKQTFRYSFVEYLQTLSILKGLTTLLQLKVQVSLKQYLIYLGILT